MQTRAAFLSLFLRKIEKVSPTGQTLYQHTYEEYDLNGNLLSERLIGNLEQTLHVMDEEDIKIESVHNKLKTAVK